MQDYEGELAKIPSASAPDAAPAKNPETSWETTIKGLDQVWLPGAPAMVPQGMPTPGSVFVFG